MYGRLEKKPRLRVALLFWLSLVNLLVCVLFAAHAYQREKNASLQGEDQRMRAASAALAAMFPEAYWTRATAAGAVTPEEYRASVELLTQYARAAGVYYLWAFYVDPGGKYHTTLTSASTEEWEKGTYPKYWDDYDPSAPLRAFVARGESGIVEDTDAFGHWRSLVITKACSVTPGAWITYGADIEISYIDRLLRRSLWRSVVIGVIGFLLTSLLSWWISTHLARGISAVVEETARISNFELEATRMRDSYLYEVSRLVEAIEDMKTGLRSFRKYVPADLVRDLIRSGEEARLGGRNAEMTIFFSDIADFTSLSEALSPGDLVAHVGEYLGAMSHIILDDHGTVDKYVGDAIMAFWGAPLPDDQHAFHACRVALRCRERLAQLNQRWQMEGKKPIHARIGINTGPVVVGNMGSELRLDYTVLGDSVNVAARLESLNKHYGTSLLISEDTLRAAGESAFVVRMVDRVTVKGKAQGIAVYELLNESSRATPEQWQLAEISARAWGVYQSRHFDEAVDVYRGLLARDPADRCSATMLARCQAYAAEPPPAAWDGVWHMGEK